MRFALALILLCFLTPPAWAQYWTHYSNPKLGFEIDIPPDFEGFGEAQDGAGQTYYRAGTRQTLEIRGGVLDGEFEELVRSLIVDNTAQGWNTTAQSSTPQWASLWGIHPTRSFFQRLILLCDGAHYAAFRMEFDTADLNSLEPVLQGLARSFVAKSC